jgi:hypothetical protein
MAATRDDQVDMDLLDDQINVHRPSEVVTERHRFDSIADAAARVVGREPFFLLCLGAVALWVVVGVIRGFGDTWLWTGALVMSVVTLLLVAILENMQRRSDQAVHRKLNTIASALAELGQSGRISEGHVVELRAAVGLETREGTRMTLPDHEDARSAGAGQP